MLIVFLYVVSLIGCSWAISPPSTSTRNDGFINSNINNAAQNPVLIFATSGDDTKPFFGDNQQKFGGFRTRSIPPGADPFGGGGIGGMGFSGGNGLGLLGTAPMGHPFVTIGGTGGLPVRNSLASPFGVPGGMNGFGMAGMMNQQPFRGSPFAGVNGVNNLGMMNGIGMNGLGMSGMGINGLGTNGFGVNQFNGLGLSNQWPTSSLTGLSGFTSPSVGLNGFNSGLNGFNNGLNGFNSGLNGFNSGLNGFNGMSSNNNGFNSLSGTNTFSNGLNGINTGISGFNPAQTGFTNGVNTFSGFNNFNTNPTSFLGGGQFPTHFGGNVFGERDNSQSNKRSPFSDPTSPYYTMLHQPGVSGMLGHHDDDREDTSSGFGTNKRSSLPNSNSAASSSSGSSFSGSPTIITRNTNI